MGHFYSVFTLEVFFPSDVWHMCQFCTISNQNCNITIHMSKMSHFLLKRFETSNNWTFAWVNNDNEICVQKIIPRIISCENCMHCKF